MRDKAPEFALIFMAYFLSGCGLYVPEKDPFRGDPISADGKTSLQAEYEGDIVDHVQCEIATGLQRAHDAFKLDWLFKKWGVTITQSITAEDQTGLSPGLTTIAPLQNALFPFRSGGTVISPQSFSFSVGGTASVNAMRTETMQYTLRNSDVLAFPCGDKPSGVLINGDLKIDDFIFDKAAIVASTNLAGRETDIPRPGYNAWTEEITFVSSYGGSVTPTWKLARISSGTGSNLLVSQRTNTNDLVITLGPLASETRATDKVNALALSKDAMSQHFARVQAAAIAVSITGQTH